MTTTARKEWRRVFTNTILALADGKLDILEAASWAIQAQYKHAERDPVEAAQEEFSRGKPPPIFPNN